jgi:hypothetical protein
MINLNPVYSSRFGKPKELKHKMIEKIISLRLSMMNENSTVMVKHHQQTGQVLAEAVVALMLMSVFLLALHQVGVQYYQWFKWSDHVHQTAYKKSIFTEFDVPADMHLVSGQRDRSQSLLQSQWGLGQRDWVSVKIDKPYKHHASFLSGIGATSTHQETTERVKENLIAWRIQSVTSQAKVLLLKPGLTAVDLPWLRAAPETDWLSKWSSTVPIQTSTAIVQTRTDQHLRNSHQPN